MDLAKTPWVDKFFQRLLDRVARAAPKPWQVPVLTSNKPVRVAEYGCGLYGCVMPTDDPDVVVKLTTDPTEAAFAVIAMAQGKQHEGVVKYHAAYAVPGYKSKLLGDKQVYVLWRQTAYSVGATDVFVRPEASGKATPREIAGLRETRNAITLYRGMADTVRRLVLVQAQYSHAARWGFLQQVFELRSWASDFIESTIEQSLVGTVEGVRQAAAALRMIELLEQEMADTPGAGLVGGALSHYRSAGLLLADVHANNVGHRAADDKPLEGIIVIDPGHAVALVQKWQSVEIPDLPQ